MRRWNRWADRGSGRYRFDDAGGALDRGSAAIEFIAIGVLMLVPLAYLIIVLAQVQQHTLGAEAAARFAARTVAEGGRADAVAEQIARQYGIDRDRMQVSVRCLPAGPCPRAGATVRLTVRADAALPFLPDAFGLRDAARLPVEATAVHKVSQYWD